MMAFGERVTEKQFGHESVPHARTGGVTRREREKNMVALPFKGTLRSQLSTNPRKAQP